MPPNLKNAYKAAIAAGALGAGLATPDDANATLVPALRQEIQNLLKQGWKQYYHYSYNPEVTMQGISDPMLYKAQKEGWKPWAGLYAADNLRKIPGHVSGNYNDTSSLLRKPSGIRSRISRMIGNHPHEPGTKGDQPIVRILVPPDARTRGLSEVDMHSYNTELKEMERLRRVEQGEIPPNMPVSLSPRTLSQHWSDVADVLQIKDVDEQPGLSEYLLMNPDKPKMFWENMSWDAYNGPQTHGPMTERTFGGVGRMRGQSRQELGLIPRPQKSLAPFDFALQPDWMREALASRSAIDALGVENAPASFANLTKIAQMPGALAAALGVGGLVSSPNEAEAGPRADALRKALRGDLFHGTPNLPEVVEKGLQQGKKYDSQKAVYLSDHPSYASQYAADHNEFGFRDGAGVYMARLDPSTRVKVQKGNTYFVTEAEAEALRKKGYDAVTTFPEPQRAGQAGLGGGLGHGEIAVINPEKILPKYGKGAIAAALGLGSLYGADEADAFPIGKLGKLNPKIMSHPRNEEALDALLGHVLRGTDEVVDVRRHPKNDWRYVVTKTAEGKHQQLPMTKDYLNVYAGARGTQKYERKFEQQGYQGKKVQALKSLSIREEKRANTSHVKDKDFSAWNTAQMEKAREIDPALVNDYVYVHVLDDAGGNTKGQSLYVPKRYAEFLAQKGYVKILKR